MGLAVGSMGEATMRNLDDYRAYKLANPDGSEREWQRQTQIRQAVADQAQIVVDHPAWQLFLNHLQAIVNDLTSKRDAKQAQLLRGSEVNEALTVLKLELRELEAERRGVALAMDLIPELIRRGHEQVAAIDKMAQPMV